MGRELLILRHAKACKIGPNSDDEEDDVRALKNKGKRHAQRMGAWLARNDLRPDCVVSSPTNRAHTTAEKCCKSAGLTADLVEIDIRIYEATLDNLLAVLRETPKAARRVMLVGHNPGAEELLLTLCRNPVPGNDKGGYLRTATLAHLRITGKWKDLSANCAELVQIVEPNTLPHLFPFPTVDGPEERIRPAYYYRQSAVVPFRHQDDELQILIISSSGKNHWVIPKGIHDPGLTAKASAAKEAFEEAGVEGRVLDILLGTYSYDKWGSACDVEVYPLKVTHEFDDLEWEERHRDRRWVSLKKAVSLVHNPDLKRIIAGLEDVLKDGE